MDIVSFLREVFPFFEKCQFLVVLFPFGKKYHFMQKVLVFGQMREFLSTVIKSCRANFGVKWRVFFSTSIFVQNCQFWAKKLELLWEMLTVWNYCALLLKVNILLENMLIFRKFWLFVWISIYIKKLSKYNKNFKFSWEMFICTCANFH